MRNILVRPQTVEIRWSPKNKEYYESVGYTFSKYKIPMLVNVDDLLPTTNVLVKYLCDYCQKEFNLQYSHYRRAINKHGTVACQSCSGIKVAEITLMQRQDRLYFDIMSICNKKGYVVLTNKSEIKNNKSIINYICPKHGHTQTRVTSLLQGKGCKKCGRDIAAIKMAQTTLANRRKKLYAKAFEAAKEKGYTIISREDEIVNNTSVINYLCPEHGIQSMRINNFINKKGCPKCATDKLSKLYRISCDEVEKRINSLGGVLLNKQDYKNNQLKNLCVKCPACGNVFLTSLSHFTQHGGQVCHECSKSESNGERKIRYYLTKNNILFEQEKYFSKCKDQRPLPFDFYLPKQHICIEFDGEQHYKNKEKFGGSLDYIQAHDFIKTSYCQSEGIKLIRIPYWEYNNIETILDDEINLHEDIV